MNTREKGWIAESLAEAYYGFRGFETIARNYHAHFGEIDIVVRKRNLLKFVEVKSLWYRVSDLTQLGDRVGSHKRRNLMIAVEKFLHDREELMETDRIFEVLFVLVQPGEIRFIPYSFSFS